MGRRRTPMDRLEKREDGHFHGSPYELQRGAVHHEVSLARTKRRGYLACMTQEVDVLRMSVETVTFDLVCVMIPRGFTTNLGRRADPVVVVGRTYW